MSPYLPRLYRPVATALACTALALPVPDAAAQQAPAAKPDPREAMGGFRPERMKSKDLAPHPAKMTVTPVEEIPLKNLQVPPGFQVELWAHGIPGGRMMARGDKGTVFVGTRTIGRVYAVMDRDGKRTSKVIAEKLVQPNGVLFHGGALYVAAINRVFRYDNIEASLDNVPQPVDMTETFKLPTEVHHAWKFLALGPDKKIYIPVGAPCNLCEVNPGMHAHIRRYNLDGSGMEIIARGVRNTVGFDFHPKTGELWFTDNGRDWGGEDGFDDELNRLPSSMIGTHFGFPYCHSTGQPDPDIKLPNACNGVQLPVTPLGAHVGALGMRFYSGKMFPSDYADSILVARRGSWNRSEKQGYDVLSIKATPDGKNPQIRPFLTGFLDKAKNAFWGRPVDVMLMPDGSVLVSDEQNGAIYRVSYKK
jgi:glucose/arabinose dehydrogenase